MATHSDSYILSQCIPFQNRVQAALLTYCTVVATEGWTVPFHRERANFVTQVLGNTSTPNPYVALFSYSSATDATVLSDATQAGTVTLTTGNVATQQALVTDTHIDNAVASQFNAYIREPA